jgi:4-hydroxy-4-methyl-2-oxoglutarate aldolase
MSSALKPVWSGARVAGPAFTVLACPSDNFALHSALYTAHRGDVLVVDGGRYSEAAQWGELMTLDAKRAGLAGVIVDGAVRDAAKLAELRFPVWARGISARGCMKNGGGSIAGPVVCGGIAVQPGDLIVADEEGVVVVPRQTIETVIQRTQSQERKENQVRERMAEGRRLFEILELDGKPIASHFPRV